MKVLAFSDFRVQSIEKLMEFLGDLKPKPDIILYGGDDISRFTQPPDNTLHRKIRYLCMMSAW